MRSLKVGGKLIWNQHLIIAESSLEREGAFKHDGRHRMEILRGNVDSITASPLTQATHHEPEP